MYVMKEGNVSMATRRTKKRKISGKSRKKQKDFQPFYKEIAVLIVFALCLFLFLSNFGLCGYVGDAISSFLFGVMGGTHYIGPVVGSLLSLLLISNDYSSLAIKKSFFALLLLCMLSAFQQMALDIQVADVQKAFLTSSENRIGGGAVGGFLCLSLYKEIGIAGTYVIVLLIAIISIILITERSLLSFLRKMGAFLFEKETKKKVQKKPRKVQKKEQKEDRSNDRREESKAKISHKKLPEFKFGRPRPEKADPMKAEPMQEPKTEASFDFDLMEEAVAEEPVVVEEPKEYHSKKSTAKKETSEEVKEVDILKTVRNDGDYVFPPVTLLEKGKGIKGGNQAELKKTAMKLQQTLTDFGVNVTITDISCGPSVTRFELHPEQGVKVSKIVSLADDIKLNLAASDIRIEAPIPGKAAVGIEVPNKTNQMVMFRDLIENNEFKRFPSNIAFAVGKNLAGKVIISDIAKMPHLLIAGATGSGKSVCINTLIMSILYKASPEEVKLIMIDPKVVELSAYQGIPHLLIPVVTDPKQASSALNWAVMEMGDRYKKFAEVNARNLEAYNEKIKEMEKQGHTGEDFQRLPQIVIIVDELADLMMVAPGEVEDAIVRLSQLARAAGIHLIIATQRPSVNVITGLIKANVPSRIAFSVSSGVDSRTIIDMNGAEKLLGKGDMLFYPSGYQKPIRVQGAFISDEEVGRVVSFLKEQKAEDDDYGSQIQEKIQTASVKSTSAQDRDEYFEDAAQFIIDKDKASIASLQRVFKIGFNRAARLMEQLCEAGIVGEEEGTKPRKVLMTPEEFEQYKEDYL